MVAIKSFLKQSQELHIAQFFASMRDPWNHCVPIHEILADPYDPELAMMVMPYLRPCNNPEFATTGDVVDFVEQTVEVGLSVVSMFGLSNIVLRDSFSCISTTSRIGKAALLPRRCLPINQFI